MKKFIHLTDLHFSNKEKIGKDTHFDATKILSNVIYKINNLFPAPDFILISGDLTNSGNIESYELLKVILNKVSIPIFYALGNHDNRKSFNQVFRKINSNEQLFYNHIFDDLNLITLDTSLPGKVSGEINSKQLEFLEKNLKKFKNLPSIIMMHHPPKFSEKSPDWISLDFKSTEALQKILRGYEILAIMCGHIHINQFNNWHGIPVICSNGLYTTIDISEKGNYSIVEGTSFNICRIRNNGIGLSIIPISPEAKIYKNIKLNRLKA